MSYAAFTIEQARRILVMLKWWEAQPRIKAPVGVWNPILKTSAAAGTSCIPGTITANSAATATSWNYTCSGYGGTPVYAVCRNGCEPCNGTPGKLGVNVGTNGTVNGGACVVQPIGVGCEVLLWPDPTVSGGFMFSVPNSAQ